MEKLENQILYKCDYCGKRFITKQGAKNHENKYCYLSPVPKQIRKNKVLACNHKWETVYDYIPGEAVKEPQYDECVVCGATEMEVDKIENEDRNGDIK